MIIDNTLATIGDILYENQAKESPIKTIENVRSTTRDYDADVLT